MEESTEERILTKEPVTGSRPPPWIRDVKSSLGSAPSARLAGHPSLGSTRLDWALVTDGAHLP